MVRSRRFLILSSQGSSNHHLDTIVVLDMHYSLCCSLKILIWPYTTNWYSTGFGLAKQRMYCMVERWVAHKPPCIKMLCFLLFGIRIFWNPKNVSVNWLLYQDCLKLEKCGCFLLKIGSRWSKHCVRYRSSAPLTSKEQSCNMTCNPYPGVVLFSEERSQRSSMSSLLDDILILYSTRCYQRHSVYNSLQHW